MTEHTSTLDFQPTDEPVEPPKVIKWCDGHWTELLTTLNDRGFGDQISADPEELRAKFLRGEIDPCWEACSIINTGAFEIFGANKIVGENGGCPVCAFANIVQHAADIISISHGDTH